MSGNKFELSYVMTTFNKKEYLCHVIPRLIGRKRDGEEIVIVDGGSTDGSREYLEALVKYGQIDQFISENDCGQGHGLNKAVMMTRGELIKPINDDDVYNYENIHYAKTFMLQHPEIDLLNGVSFVSVWEPEEKLLFHGISDIESFLKPGNILGFSDITMMIRKSSIPLLGLFNPNIHWMDYEYSIRATSLPAKICYLEKPIGIRLTNPKSVSVKFFDILEEEKKRINGFYVPAWTPNSNMDYVRSLKNYFFFLIKERFKNIRFSQNNGQEAEFYFPGVSYAFEKCEQWLQEEDHKYSGKTYIRK